MTENSTSKFDTMMIIDDNTIDLYITARMALKKQFAATILEYSSAVEALEYLKENTADVSTLPQIILVDIYMPLMSGFEFMEAYNHLPEELKKKCRVYIVSSTIDVEDLKRINEDENIEGFHEKPITKAFFEKLLAV